VEHLLRLVDSKATLYVAVSLFTLGVILWLAWARFFHERERWKAVPHFVMGLSVWVVLVGCYAFIARRGLDGVACVAGRYSSHRTCFSHDGNPWAFWVVAGGEAYFLAILMLVMLVFLVRLVVPGRPGTAASPRHLRRASDAGEERPVVRDAKRGGAFGVLQFVAGGIVIATLAWVALSLDEVSEVRRQVAGAFALVAPERGVVETYLREHGRLPEDNTAAALPAPAGLRRQSLSEVQVVKGSLLLKFDAATANAHLAGRQVLLIAVRDDGQVHWHCATLDVDDRYLPVHCLAGL
jgi:hypothetical protein